MMGEKTHIALIHDERVPKELLDKFCTDVNSESLDFKRAERPEQGTSIWIRVACYFRHSTILL